MPKSDITGSHQTDDVSNKLYHPLFDVTLPTISDLEIRASEDVRGVLRAACQLAAYREACIDKLEADYKEFLSFPASKPMPDIESLREPYVTELDVVRAFVGLHANYLHKILFSKSYKASGQFSKSAWHWAKLLNSTEFTDTPVRIEKRWARRLAMLFLSHPELKITKSQLAFLLVHAFPVEWYTKYVDGLLTRKEALYGFFYTAYLALSTELEALKVLPTIPPAYIDRHGVIPQIEAALVHSPGILVVSDSSVARRSIVDLLCSTRPYTHNLDWRADASRQLITEPVQTIYFKLAGKSGDIFSLKGSDARLGDVAIWGSDYNNRGDVLSLHRKLDKTTKKDQAKRLDVSQWVTTFEGLARIDALSSINFVVSMTQVEYDHLLGRVHSMERVPVIKIPGADKKDVLLSYLAHLPFYYDETKCDIDLGLLLDFLSQDNIAGSSYLDVECVSKFVESIHPEVEDLGLDIRQKQVTFRPFESLFRPRPYATPKGSLKSILRRARRFFVEYIGDIPDLDKLARIHWMLVNMRKDQPDPLNYAQYGSVSDLLDDPNLGNISRLQ